MLAKQTLDLIKRRRTSRYFDKYSEVSKQSLERILEAAIWAPFSIYQLQDWKFIVLTDKARDQAAEIILEDPTVLKYIRVMYENTSWGEDDNSWLILIEDFG
jgi:nitroreductase